MRRRRLPNEKTSVGCRRPPKRNQKNTGRRHPRALGSRRYCGKTATLRWGIAFSGCSRRLPFSCLCCEAFHFSGVFSHSFQHTRFSGGHVGAGVCVCLISRAVRRAARILSACVRVGCGCTYMATALLFGGALFLTYPTRKCVCVCVCVCVVCVCVCKRTSVKWAL